MATKGLTLRGIRHLATRIQQLCSEGFFKDPWDLHGEQQPGAEGYEDLTTAQLAVKWVKAEVNAKGGSALVEALAAALPDVPVAERAQLAAAPSYYVRYAACQLSLINLGERQALREGCLTLVQCEGSALYCITYTVLAVLNKAAECALPDTLGCTCAAHAPLRLTLTSACNPPCDCRPVPVLLLPRSHVWSGRAFRLFDTIEAFLAGASDTTAVW